MKLLQFGENQEAILAVLAAILHIGNLKFAPDEKIEDTVRVENLPGSPRLSLP